MTDVTAADVARELRRDVRGGVHQSPLWRAEYSSDASNYRVVPDTVVCPVDVDDLRAVVAVAHRTGAALTLRGGGTSIAGNAIGPGIVVDTSRHLTRILDLDPQAGTARVEPGVVLSDLQAAAAPHGLRFGPDPSTASRATLGGMVGNDACGAHTVSYGRTADNVASLEVVDGEGRELTAARGLSGVPGLRQLVARHQGALRAELGRFGRQVSGYAMEHLLPEHGEHVAKALVGSEGTLATVLTATVRLAPAPRATTLVVLGYPDMAAAADAVPQLLPHQPLAVEGIDARMVDVVRRHGGAVPDLPAGRGWLLVEVGGEEPGDAEARARALVADAGTDAARVITAPAQAAAMWRIRADGVGLAGRTPRGRQAWPGWEDAAVPPEQLGAYLRRFEELLADYDYDGLPYGHFGDGCVHVRIDAPLQRADQVGVFRAFVEDAARLVVAHGGSLSGEHGDGRARSELLGSMYSAEALAAFRGFKGLFDPHGRLNPGVLVEPDPVAANLRRPAARPLTVAGGFAHAEDDGDLTTAAHRCVGIGKCRADHDGADRVMCPSFLATRREQDSTRGRARLLQEAANGELIHGLADEAVHDALDLCLSCKACATECPAGVDMATYKAEALQATYRRRPRPASHYTLGWLPRWAALATRAPRLVNRVLGSRLLARAALAAGGVDARRSLPAFAPRPFTAGRRGRRGRGAGAPPSRGAGSPRRVVLWVDSFSDAFRPGIPQAAADVLQQAGYEVVLPPGGACCGLTWISTGQLDGARRRLRRLVAALAPHAMAGTPIVGLEPSCTAVLRSDLTALLPDDAGAAAVSRATHTLAELLTAARASGETEWQPPDLSGTRVVCQPHCHHRAIMGFDADERLLAEAGASVAKVAGCCGLAGNFGMERGHYDVSVAVARQALLPALDDDGDAELLADGFSCRTQAAELDGRAGVHLAELLAAGGRSASGDHDGGDG